MRLFLISLSALLYSCNPGTKQKEPFKTLLQNCNEVNILFYNGGDTLHFKTNDSSGVTLFKEAVSGGKENLTDTCMPMGELRYLNQLQPVLVVQFAVKEVSNKDVCNYITYSHSGTGYKHKLSKKGKDLLLQMATGKNR